MTMAYACIYTSVCVKSAEATRITHWSVDSEITQQRVGQCRFYHIKAAHKSSELYNFYALIITCPGNFITGIFHLSAVDQSEYIQPSAGRFILWLSSARHQRTCTHMKSLDCSSRFLCQLGLKIRWKYTHRQP
jgi:hypothetical protein